MLDEILIQVETSKMKVVGPLTSTDGSLADTGSLKDFLRFERRVQECDAASKVARSEYLRLAWTAVELANRSPIDRERIAYLLVSIGARIESVAEKSLIKRIIDRFADLELPDRHIDARNGTVDEQWNELASWIESALLKMEK